MRRTAIILSIFLSLSAHHRRWQLGRPDLIVELPSGFDVPAHGADVYRNFVIPLSLAEDKWVRAIEFRPSARSSVHHVLFFSDTSGAARQADAADSEPGFGGMGGRRWRSAPLGGWTPGQGQQPHAFPEGIALPLPKGADLVLQYHFHPHGKAETERAQVSRALEVLPGVRPANSKAFASLKSFRVTSTSKFFGPGSQWKI